MTRSSAAGTVALMIGAFAGSFFATVLIRKSATSAEVAASTWTRDAEAAARTREREESLSRSVAALRLESRRLNEQIARKSQELSVRVGKLRSEGAATPDRKDFSALDNVMEPLTKMMIREKIRAAKEELGLNGSQLATYEARLKEAVEKNPLQLVETNAAKFDEETLVPLLDREQLEKHRDHLKKQAEAQARTDTQQFVDVLGVPEGLAGKVAAILREEGVEDQNAIPKLLGDPESARGLVPKIIEAKERARVRLRPLLPPEAFEKLERYFQDGTEALTIMVEELRKEEKKD